MTKNFKKSEFDCKCGCEMPNDVFINIQKLANQLQYVREFLDLPINLTNGYRCPTHNKAVGGVKNSQHVLGKAADIKIKGLTPQEVAVILDRLTTDGEILQGGIGIYNTFTHFDIRGKKARWDNRT